MHKMAKSSNTQLPTLVSLLVIFQIALATRNTKPNIILFVIDDLGWNDTSYQGADYDTPTLDRLTREGIRLKQYYVQQVCTPSRAALLAGKYAYTLGLAAGVITNGQPYGLNLSEVTIAQQLKKGGYSTHAVGKYSFKKSFNLNQAKCRLSTDVQQSIYNYTQHSHLNKHCENKKSHYIQYAFHCSSDVPQI